SMVYTWVYFELTKGTQPMATQEPPQADPWLHKKVDKIDYFVHRPTRQSGIHIRGLAALCGVAHTTIMGILRNIQKGNDTLVGLRATDLYTLLKDKTIFLDTLVGLSPKLNGKEVKVILASPVGYASRTSSSYALPSTGSGNARRSLSLSKGRRAIAR
ncbi:hypothetical protein TI04_13835, partial [Achromatium sp. WMS2]